MAKLRFPEVIGTSRNDTFYPGSQSITYGLNGDDTFRAVSYSEYNFLAGGSGNDKYYSAPGAAITIYDTGGVDTLFAPRLGVYDPYTYVATVDGGKHLIVGSSVYGDQIAVANWRASGNTLEYAVLSDGTFSMSQIIQAINVSPNYLGDFSVEYLSTTNILPSGTTKGDVEEFLSYINRSEMNLVSLKSFTTISASTPSVSEGETAVFEVTTTNLPPGTRMSYTISGISANDISGQPLTGSFSTDKDGRATISIPIMADEQTEGIETLTVETSTYALIDIPSTVHKASISILDTSVSNLPLFLNYDTSISNDPSIRQTVQGNINVFQGSAINNIIVGTAGDDHLYGYGGDDRFLSTAGNDVFDGGDGLDTITFEGVKQDFVISKTNTGFTIRDVEFAKLLYNTPGINEGTDSLISIERIDFRGGSVALDTNGAAGQAYRLYKATFDRVPDSAGLGYWIAQIDAGMDMVEVAERFLGSDEFRSLYGQNPTNGEFLTKVYKNVLDRDPDQGGYAWWIDQLENNPEKTWNKVLADFSESVENQENVAELIANGISFFPWDG